MNLQFANLWVLLLLWGAPAIAVWAYALNRGRERNLQRFISKFMQAKLQPPSASVRFAWQAGLLIAGLSLFFVAAARPQWGIKEVAVFQRGRDVVIALDVSRSMLANDVHPNRLERAKIDIMDLIQELRGDRAALLAFRHKAALLCPLTTDYAYLRQALDAADIHSAPRGETNIGDAIMKALDAFESREGSHKAIVLISDGEDFSGKALDGAEQAKKRRIPIFTVGLGSQSGARIPDRKNSKTYIKYKGKEIVSALNNETLDKIAQISGGAYVPIGLAGMTSVTLGTLYRNHLRTITAQDFEETLERRRIERYQLFLLPAFLCVLATMFLSRGRLSVPHHEKFKKQERPRQNSREDPETPALKNLSPPKQPLKNLTVFLLSTGVLMSSPASQATNAPPSSVPPKPSTAPAAPSTAPEEPSTIPASPTPPGRSGARIAQGLYRRGKYEEAARIYLDAARSSTRKSQRDFRYNAAVSLFKAGKHKEAADLFRDLAQTGEAIFAPAAMGLGSALFRSAELPDKPTSTNIIERAARLRESGEAFRIAARADDGAQDSALQNLAVILDRLPEAEKQALIQELLDKYEKAPAPQIALEMLSNQRELSKGLSQVLTNDTPSLIRDMEDLADRQKTNADLWIPLKGKLLGALAQSQDPNSQKKMADFERQIEITRRQMMDASSGLRDLEPSAHTVAAGVEATVYQIWKSIAPYPQLLQEDIRQQTNTIALTSGPAGIDENKRLAAKRLQDEAATLTKLFAERFSQAAPEPAAPPDGNNAAPSGNISPQTPGPHARTPQSPPQPEAMSPETRRKILELAEQALVSQKRTSHLLEQNDIHAALEKERASYSILKEIEKLLPKDQKQPPQQQDKQQKQKPQDQPDDVPPEDEAKPKEKQQPQEQEEDKTPEDAKRILEKALQREKEHEEEKRRRLNSIPMAPHERDW